MNITMPMTLRTRRLPPGFWKGSTARTKKARTTTRAVKSLAPRARKAVATIAKRVMNRKIETKYASSNTPEYAYQAVYGSTYPQGGIPQIFGCLPQVPVGAEESSYTRSGNKINPTRHVTDLRFVFNDDAILDAGGAKPASQAGWDITVHVWYGFAKRYKQLNDAVIVNGADLLEEHLQDGHGAKYQWGGLLSDETKDINKEVFMLKHKTLRMYKNAGLANAGDVTAPSLSTPMSEARRLRLSWKAPKVLSYADEEHILPENYAPFIIVGYCHNDATQASYKANAGVTADLDYIPAVKMLKIDKLYYKDA